MNGNASGDGVELLAHGIAGRQDLPIPLGFAVTGAGAAVLVSFVAMALVWKTSRLRGDDAGRSLSLGLQRVVDSALLRMGLRVVVLLATAFVGLAAAYGPQDTLINPTAGMVYVFFWVGLVPLSLLFGPVWKVVNPLRTVHLMLARSVGADPEQQLVQLPGWIGHWPAAVGLLAFTWFELVYPAGNHPRILLMFFGLYGTVHLLAAALFGAGWFTRADAFEVYSTLIGRLAPVGRRADGRLVLRNPFDGLDGVRLEPGLVAVVCVLLGSTAYDGFSRSVFWVGVAQSGVLPGTAVATLAFLAAILLAAALYVGCTVLATKLGTPGRRALPQQFAHSLVPIAVGYIVAHYFSLLIYGSQQTVVLATDPLDTGADLFGTAGLEVNFGLVSTTATAVVQVAAVVTGHILGVVAAHDRAARLFPRRQALAGQIPLLVLMVGYTVGGLSLLFAA